jgi:hypothetical protein
MQIEAPEFEDGGMVVITLTRKPGNALAYLAETVFTPAEAAKLSKTKLRETVQAHVDFHAKAKEITDE